LEVAKNLYENSQWEEALHRFVRGSTTNKSQIIPVGGLMNAGSTHPVGGALKSKIQVSSLGTQNEAPVKRKS
jgi:hypothetical protein